MRHSLGGDVWRERMEWRRGSVEGDRGIRGDGREEEKGIGKRGIGKNECTHIHTKIENYILVGCKI